MASLSVVGQKLPFPSSFGLATGFYSFVTTFLNYNIVFVTILAIFLMSCVK